MVFSTNYDSEGKTPPDKFVYFISRTSSQTLSSSTAQTTLDKYLGAENSIKIPDGNLVIDMITYRTKNARGKEISVSSMVAYPEKGAFRGSILALHGTITNNSWAPTSGQSFDIEPIFGLLGYAVVMPDYIGYGASSAEIHPYMHSQLTASASIDAYLAAQEYLQTLKRSLAGEVILMGYSQGAAAAIATQKLAEQEYSDEFTIKKVYAGSGPYDLIATQKQFIAIDKSSMPVTLALTVLGLNDGDNLDLNLDNILRGPILNNYSDWILSKKYTASEIMKFMGSNKTSDFMHPDWYKENGNQDINKLYASFAKNSLIDGWRPKAPILLMHGSDDTAVPIINSQNLYNKMKSQNCAIELVIVPGDHMPAAIPFYTHILQNLI